MGQTDRRTDGRTAALLIAPTIGRGHNDSEEMFHISEMALCGVSKTITIKTRLPHK